MIGLTFDSVDRIDKILDYLSTFKERPTVRFICDEPGSGFDWEGMKRACRYTSNVADIVMMVVDSYYMKRISAADYVNRTKKVVDMYGEFLGRGGIEIGNELGGDWLGNDSVVYKKVSKAQEIVAKADLDSFITWYLDGNDKGEAMWKLMNSYPWISTYHLISWYPNWGGVAPAWHVLFDSMRIRFTNTFVGFGEFGEEPKKYSEAQRVLLIKEMYRTMNSLDENPNFIGGGFYWNARDSVMKKQTKVLEALRGY